MAHILIVEDEEAVRSLAARALAREGHEIDTAADGEEGLARITERAGSYDLVLSDIRMPAMDGIEMARRASAAWPSLKILFVTGYADQRERTAELEGTVLGVLEKPFSLGAIRERVALALATQRNAA